MRAASLIIALVAAIAGCAPESSAPLTRKTILRSFADEVTTVASVSIGRYRHALATVQGLAVADPITYSFAVTLPSETTLLFRPLMHPAAESCWREGPNLRVVLRQQLTDVELWASDLTPQIGLRTRLWVQAALTRLAPGWAPRSLVPPQIALPIGATGRAELRFEATGRRQPCALDGWYAKNGGHIISPAAVWGMPVLQGPEFADRPDVVIVVIDTLRADALRLHGGAAHTPNLDEFAKSAVVFNRALTTYPMTREATFSLMTGGHPVQLGVPFWRWSLVDAERKVAAAWAAHSLPVQARQHGLRSLFAGNNGFLSETVHLGYDGRWGEVRFFYKEPYDADDTLRTFERWGDDPQRMFAYVHFNQPHWPHTAAKGFAARAADGLPAEYLSEIAEADAYVGRVFEILRRNKRFEKSVIIVTSDHGELFPAGEKAGHGTTLRLGELHIPLLIRYPYGLYGGRTIRDTVSLADVAPTIREYMGWAAITTWGRSLMPLIRGDYARLPARRLFWEGRGVYGYSAGDRFYTAHLPDYLPMRGLLAGEHESASIWPEDTSAPVSVEPTDEDRIALGQLMDAWDAERRRVWTEFAGLEGEPPLPPQPVYVLRAAGARVETVPRDALREISRDEDELRFTLVPPSTVLTVRADTSLELGPWGLPFGGRETVIRTDSERRLLIGKPRASKNPALWIDTTDEGPGELAPEVKEALRGWGYVR